MRIRIYPTYSQPVLRMSFAPRRWSGMQFGSPFRMPGLSAEMRIERRARRMMRRLQRAQQTALLRSMSMPMPMRGLYQPTFAWPVAQPMYSPYIGTDDSWMTGLSVNGLPDSSWFGI